MSVPLCKLGFLAAAVLCLQWTGAQGAVQFNRDIVPILSENCYHCHGQDGHAREAHLRLDRQDGLFRVEDGVTVVKKGEPEQSDLIERIFSSDQEEVMPPPKSHRALTDKQKALLREWVQQGAPWEPHWAFIGPKWPALPMADAAPANPVDALIEARLREEALPANPPAPAATQLRRVTLDLTGLPPTPEELDAFLADSAPGAYERAVDRLLASPRYGERWAWDWLDAARYADTNGYQNDPERTMWPWRDWVVKALNDNMPFDQFTVWQLAGDLLPEATAEQKLATGFHRNHMMNGEGGRIAEESRVENVFDRVETTATVWLGLTMQCTKCHDHKFDALTMRDYYGLYDFFNQTSETGKNAGGRAEPALEMSTEAERARAKATQEVVRSIANEVKDFEDRKFPHPEGTALSDSPEVNALPGNLPRYVGRTGPSKRKVTHIVEIIEYFKERDPAYSALHEKLLAAVREADDARTNVTSVMVMDTATEPRETFMLVKGAYDKKTETRVTANTPAILPALEFSQDHTPTRLDLARWLVSPQNPLTARVTVNRAWQAFFGTGLVKTAEDFGVQGEKPSQPELLDWLACQYLESGWDTKALHRLIVTSQAYRRSSQMTAEQHERDPENRLLARGPRYRLPSWMLRDQALALSGLLVERAGGQAVMPYQPEGIWEEATFGFKHYVQGHRDDLYRRTLYTFWRRIIGPPDLFDNSARQVCSVRSSRTNTPLHALVTLNDPTYVESARLLAQRILKAPAATDDATRLAYGFRLATGRPPLEGETELLAGTLAKFRAEAAADPAAAQRLASAGETPRDESLAPAEHAAWTSLSLLLLNLDETLTQH